jgi:hypothetical protein
MILIFFFTGLCGWAGFGYQLWLHHHRRPEVYRWANNVYETGYRDALWGSGRDTNKKFSVGAVMDAYDGAWD